jgi:thiol-disulfide isomerase/thioredoxin
MPFDKVKFTDLEEALAGSGKTCLDYLAQSVGKAYVIAVTRDGCSACEKQEPELERLAERLAGSHNGKVIFTHVHVKQPSGSTQESIRSKDVLGHYFYPTNFILIRTSDRGAIEYYRAASPDIEELEKHIEKAVEIAAFFDEAEAV